MKDPLVRTNLHLGKKQRLNFKKLVKKLGISMSERIRQLIDEDLLK